jgi:hypothetical protein
MEKREFSYSSVKRTAVLGRSETYLLWSHYHNERCAVRTEQNLTLFARFACN